LLDGLNPTIAELSRAIEQEAEKFPEARCLMTHPGVGALTALAFVLILGRADRFQCGKQIASYLGLVPLEDSSGNRRRLGRAGAAHGDAESRVASVAGALLFALAAFVAVTSVTSLLGYSEPKPTFLGIAILVAAAVAMPWLAREKRRLSGATGSAALKADAVQSALCAYLSLIALAGLAINAIWSVKWADPIAALAVLPLIVWEGREAVRGKTCGCC
jgi:hypothetical protein